jgi:hypothetical protein
MMPGHKNDNVGFFPNFYGSAKGAAIPWKIGFHPLGSKEWLIGVYLIFRFKKA